MKIVLNIRLLILPVFAFLSFAQSSFAQEDPVVQAIVKETNENSQLEQLAHELLDIVGPRLVGTPQMTKANEWAVAQYKKWGISAKSEQWGEWRGWERGITHIDMLTPRVRSLEGTQMAWSPSTGGKEVTGEVLVFPDLPDSIAFKQWLPSAKGKFVLMSINYPTGHPDNNWTDFGTKESVAKMQAERMKRGQNLADRMRKAGNLARIMPALENAGVAGLIYCSWSSGFGVNKVMSGRTRIVPSLDLSLEDYGLLYRLAESGQKPTISARADSKELGVVPVYNTIAEIKGTEKPEEYVVLSAHLDSWDSASGATDNGTGTILMMETMRILKKIYPNPKRTILVGHWGSEEQGLNGSRAFVEDHPEIVKNIQAVFNQDNGTGRVEAMGGQSFVHAPVYLTRWLSKVPEDIRKEIKTPFPGNLTMNTDNASFALAGAPAFFLNALHWTYLTYTWHTNRDTYDKIVFDDVRRNAILAAVLVYMACEDPERASGERIPGPVMPLRPATRRGGILP